MSRKTGRAIAASCMLGAAGGASILIYTLNAGGGAAAQAMPEIGRFRVGSEFGMERAGFSGRPMLMIFATAGGTEWEALSSCLQSPEVETRLGHFTPILIDEATEPEADSLVRSQEDIQVVVRGMNGAFLGGLRRGFACADLVGLLDRMTRLTPAIEKSPIYAQLLESAEAIDALKTRGEAGSAEKYVKLLREFEGPMSPAVQAAEAALRR